MIFSLRTIALLLPLCTLFFFAAQLNAAGIGKKLWQKSYDSGHGNEWSFGVAIDKEGQVLPVGTTQVQDPQTQATDQDRHAKKYTLEGTEINNTSWPITEDWGGADDEFIDISMDSNNNLRIGGYRHSKFNKVKLTVGKYDNNGSYFWRNEYDKELASEELSPKGPGGVAVDSSDNVYACGAWTGTGGTNDPAGFPRWVILGYNNAGIDLNGSGSLFPIEPMDFYGRAWDVTVDSQDNFIVVGSKYISGSVNNDDEDYDIHILKYSFNGTDLTLELTITLTTPLEPNVGSLKDVAYAVAVDSQDNIIIAGTTNSGTDNTSTYANYDWFVAKYDGNNGTRIWSHKVEAPTVDQAYSVVIDSNDNLYLGGNTNDHWHLQYRAGIDGTLLNEKDWNDLAQSRLYGMALRDNKLALSGAYNSDISDSKDYADWHVELYDVSPFSWLMFMPALATQ